MELNDFLKRENEKPLDRIVNDGGFCSIFRTIACVGDSLSSGEFESTQPDGSKGYHDYFEYSWGQYIARMIGARVYNFSRGGMTAREYCQSFAEQNDFWNPDKAAQAYIMALGANDLNGNIELGSADDIDLENCENNKETFAGYYAKIIQKYRAIEPKSRFFLMTMPRAEDTEENKEKNRKILAHQELLYRMAEVFPFTYVLDLVKYAPVYDTEFRKNFFLGGHMNPAGYVLTAKMTASYIDYIIRSNMEDFSQVGFIGTGFHNAHAKW